ncbi:MAG: hypothetical protein IJT96_08430 [Lachnospiraceae bacterium]|nr:hypothetical protein [Lachnospiraceae bacterium]
MEKGTDTDIPIYGYKSKRGKNIKLERIFEFLCGEYECTKCQLEEMIIRKCRTDFEVSISKKQIQRILRIRHKLPYKCLIILMGLYNLIYESKANVEDKELKSLISFVSGYGIDETYDEFAMQGRLLNSVYKSERFLTDDRYSKMFDAFCGTYDIMHEWMERSNKTDYTFYDICSACFPLRAFTKTDIPRDVRDIERVYISDRIKRR